MKPRLLIVLISVSISHEQNYGSRFQTPGPGVSASENSIYLPPETVTPAPYFPVNQMNKLPFPYLPLDPIKAPTSFPTPFPPIMISSTFRPPSRNDYEDEDDEEDKRPSPPRFSFFDTKNNRTEQNTNVFQTQRLDMRNLPKTVEYQHPIDRIDMKPEIRKPQQFTLNNRQIQNGLPKPPQRNVVVSPEKRNDQGIDQAKSGNFPIPQYLPLPSLFISSTTETAIPILRLSNEMDLDGSFSYEALGADQTHYVQHSRMENIGNDKQEQVVEGSYSYVGDDGQTYSVHYIADANGFRASGDHLPVPPPVPEIIQRAVQHNLAEEARKPAHLKNWNEEDDIYQDTERNTFTILPTHNLYTGRTPESFSFNFLEAANSQNNLLAATSPQSPLKSYSETFSEHLKTRQSSTISPQITFLASQGAHIPSASMPQPTITRLNEKTTMPQLVNYEAAIKETEPENKNLLKWQYNANKDNNQTPDKNSISRSFGEDDDVMINFNEMTPEQYTNMIHSKIETQTLAPRDSFNEVTGKYQLSNLANIKQDNVHLDRINKHVYTSSTSTESNSTPNELSYMNNFNNNDWANNYNSNYKSQSNAFDNKKLFPSNDEGSQVRAKIITQNKFIPPSQTVSQSYDYIDSNNNVQMTKIVNSDVENRQYKPESTYLNTSPVNHQQQQYLNWLNINKKNEIIDTRKTDVSSESSYISTANSIDIVARNENNDFSPVTVQTVEPQEETTTENFNDNLKENIFLKRFFKRQKEEKIVAPKDNADTKSLKEKQVENHPKYIQTDSKKFNNENIRPFQVSDIINLISAKNYFESNKLKNSNKLLNNNQYNKTHLNRNNLRNHYEEEPEIDSQQFKRENKKNMSQEELHGVIRNYKVLQRNNVNFNKERNLDQIRKDLTPSGRKENLPPLGRAGPSMKSYLPAIYV
ncbi:homeobox protein 2-like [Bombyx mandarina]|uniref:Homeobox protein 2-like n=1 Tax=Bombyx mandarina TaxID=7092 RepID=A0A6J2K9W4_BOMMA|nr:homeobox protein 2-like [Bombyx mandarina]